MNDLHNMFLKYTSKKQYLLINNYTILTSYIHYLVCHQDQCSQHRKLDWENVFFVLFFEKTNPKLLLFVVGNIVDWNIFWMPFESHVHENQTFLLFVLLTRITEKYIILVMYTYYILEYHYEFTYEITLQT